MLHDGWGSKTIPVGISKTYGMEEPKRQPLKKSLFNNLINGLLVEGSSL
jgi:hypothetical protein